MGQGDSKIAFRKGLVRLAEDKELQATGEAEFWDGFWTIPASIDETFSLIAPADVRKVLTDMPANMTTLLSVCVDTLADLVKDGSTPLEKLQVPKVLNILRILIRVLPFVFEDTGTHWQSVLFEKVVDEATNKTFGEKLVDLVLNCLFLPGLTLPDSVTKRKDGTYAIIWETGVGATHAPPSSYEVDTNRTEVIKLLLVLTSQILYPEGANFRTYGVYFTDLIMKRISKTTVMALLGSLINVVMQYDPVGVGVPYNYMVFSDTREALANVALQMLLVLLDYRYPFEASEIKSPVNAEASEHLASKNLFQEYFSRIHRLEDFNVIIVGLNRLLNNPIVSASTYLPGSSKSISFQQELIIFTWKLLELNKRFLAFVVQDALLLDVLGPILVYTLEARLDEGKQGLVHVTCFLLLLLSGERNFGVRLNKVYDNKYPQLKLPMFEGNYADVLILSLYKLITDCDKGKLFSLFDCMLTVIANVSPYIKSLSSVTSHKLLSLFRSFTSPRFLLANSSNHCFCGILIDIFNNIIQYQFDGNVRLVYAILRQKELFEKLSDFDLESAQNAIKEKQKSKSPNETETDPEHIIDHTANETKSQKDGTESAANSMPPSPSTPTPQPQASTPSSPQPKEMVSISKAETSKVHGFVPTEEWIRSWKRTLALGTIIRLLNILVPQIEKICVDRGIVSEEEVLRYLSSGTLVGLLPVPHPIMVRKYKPNQGTYAWATIYMWGVIYLRNLNPPIWFGTKVDLFVVKKI